MGCTIFVLEGIERSPSINYGIRRANGEYVYRVDSDVILDRNLVAQAVQACIDQGCDAVSVFWSPDPSIGFWARVRKLEKDCYKHDIAHSGARFFKREVIDAIGGFNEALIAGEDYDLINRLLRRNYGVCSIEAEEMHIGEPTCIADIARKQFYYGRSLKRFLVQNRREGVVQVSPFRRALFEEWRGFVRKPDLMIGFVIYQVISYSSGILGFIAGHFPGNGRRAHR
jgi:glycosyltransferase involved in cell wall biosynthesis